MNKKAIVIYLNGELLDVCEVKSFTDENEYSKLVKTAKENKEKLLKQYKKDLERNKNINELETARLNKKNELLNVEIKLLKGEIDEDVYYERKDELNHSIETIEKEIFKLKSEVNPL